MAAKGEPWSEARRAAGGKPCSAEQREKIGAAKRGKPMSEAARANMRAAHARRREAMLDRQDRQPDQRTEAHRRAADALGLIEHHAALRRSGKGF